MGAGALYAITGVPGGPDLAKVFGVSTDYLLGLERLTTVDVTGLADRDVAVLAELAERLKNCKD
ncbi:hypothetical protein NIA13_03945 [Oscillibacter valericigenes]|nr:hypothetical protein [Oscillibacter valericigenes]